MSESEEPSPNALPAPDATYTIEMVAKITHIPQEEIVVYYQSGFVSPVDESRLIFDDEAVHQLRRLAFLLSEYKMNREGLKMVSSLLKEVERLREEVRFFREK